MTEVSRSGRFGPGLRIQLFCCSDSTHVLHHMISNCSAESHMIPLDFGTLCSVPSTSCGYLTTPRARISSWHNYDSDNDYNQLQVSQHAAIIIRPLPDRQPSTTYVLYDHTQRGDKTRARNGAGSCCVDGGVVVRNQDWSEWEPRRLMSGRGKWSD